MIRESTEPETDADERPPISAREIVSIRTTQEELGVARCPLCRSALVARQGRAGPYFSCRCVRTSTKRAS